MCSKKIISWNGLALPFIILVGFLLRLYGVGFGLPFLYHADEPMVVNHALAYSTLDFNPHYFVIPPLVSYMLFPLYGVYFLIGKVTGLFSSPFDFKVLFFNDPSTFYLIGRFFCGVLPGTLSIYVLYVLVKRFFDEKTALISALFFSINFLHVQNSHYIYTDIFLVLGILLVALASLKLYKNPTLKNYIYAGLLVGLVTAIKYNGAVIFIMVLISHILNFRYKKILYVFISGVFTVIAFTLLNPFSVLDFKFFISQIMDQSVAECPQGFLHHIDRSLFEGCGLLISIFGFLGIIKGLTIDFKKHAITSSFVILFLIILAFFSQDHERYALVLVPFICMYAAYFFVSIFRTRIFAAIAIVALIVMPFLKSVYSDYLFTKKDTRTLMAEWIEAYIPQDSKIAVDNSFHCPRLRQNKQQLEEKLLLTEDVSKKEKIEILINSEVNTPSYFVYYLKNEDSLGTGFLFGQPQLPFYLRALRDNGIQYVVIRYGVRDGKNADFYRQLKKEAILLERISPYFDSNRKYSNDFVLQTAGPFITKDLFSRKSSGYVIEVYKLQD